MNLTGKLKQKMTYWSPSSLDMYGQQGFSTPIVLSCRYEAKSELYHDTKGDETLSNAIFYTASTALQIEGFVFQGTSTAASPEDVAGAFEIKKISEIPSLNNSQRLIRVIV